ncbi:hypothetical protein [Glycomyces paridis]|uniref:Uncharacterized protein n=1 Tax=Glycomyces paridis TaxID=2126555 RepID=A0A4S8PGM4_9ACTN|nr:hypothetical protein [Glycomyces paridis]THV28755.1 hypothetical protein E9998_11690 [Glycomyces paridis]
MLGWTLTILLVFAIAVILGWKHLVARMLGPLPEPEAMPEPVPFERFDTVLMLPSALSTFKFACSVTIWHSVANGLEDEAEARRAAEWEIHQTARAVTSQYSPSVFEFLDLALNDALNAFRKTGRHGLIVRAECAQVKVDPKDLALTRELEQAEYELNMEAQLHVTRMRNAERLGQLLSDPRSAALWWFARHPDRVQELPGIARTMFEIDAVLNHRMFAEPGTAPAAEQPGPTNGEDLDNFLANAGEEKRTLLCNTLAFAYEKLGRPEMAARVRTLADLSGPEPASQHVE